MRTTIDRAGRVVIPKPVRDATGLRPGQEVEIREREGLIEIEPVGKRMTLVERDGFLAAEVEGEAPPPLTVEEVRSLLERVRR